MMSADSAFFAFSLVDTSTLLFLSVYIVITLSDLECDYLNAPQCCTKLNKWVLPEFLAVTALTILLLFTGHWILFILYWPMIAWLLLRQHRIPRGNLGTYDPTEIHNKGNLKKHIRDSVVRLCFHLVFFFIFLYSLIIALLTKAK
ncbi:Protein cornichon -like protein 4 [Halotydeus destructor]|nr:Protein cornichon -like protein 4 [Halotydeus destructor]